MNIKNNNQGLKSKTKVTNSIVRSNTIRSSTMLNTMIHAKKITNHAGKNIVIFTAYQQLYGVALEIMWTEPNRFQSFISCLWHAVDHEFCRKYWGSNENQWHTSLVAKKGIWGMLKKC